MKKIIFIFLILFNPLMVLAEETDKYQDALLATADSFLNKGTSIQYGNERLTYLDARNAMRSEIYFKPEEVNGKNIFYTTCAQFAYMLYYNTFESDTGDNYKIKSDRVSPHKLGNSANPLINLADNSHSNYSSDIAVYYKVGVTESDIQEALSKVEIGDIIIYRWNGTSAHAMTYYGNNIAIESTGGIYNFKTKTENFEESGSIRKVSLTDKTQSTSLFKRILDQATKYSDTTIAIIRPLNEVRSNNYKITDANIRKKYRNLVIEGTPNNDRFDAVNINNTIAYTIKLENKNSTAYNNIEIKVPIPENTTLYELPENATFANNTLTWNINIASSETKTLTYTIKVNNDESLYGSFIDSEFYIDTMKINYLSVPIGNMFTHEEEETLKSKINNVNNKTYSTTKDYINDIYEHFNIEIEDIDTITNTLFTPYELSGNQLPSSEAITSTSYGNQDKTYLINTNNTQTIRVLNPTGNSIYHKMLINGLYGGIYTIDNRYTIENPTKYPIDSTIDLKRLRYVDMNDFNIGDLLFINNKDIGNTTDEDGELHNIFIYADNNKFTTIENKKVVTYQDENAKTLINKLIGQDNFYILKPSLIFNKTPNSNQEKPSSQDNIPENPNTGITFNFYIVMTLFFTSLIILITKKKKL